MPPPRARLCEARRIVVKIGTRVLAARTGRPNRQRMRALVGEIAALQRADRQLVVVSSGAIGAGVAALGLSRRPTNLPDLQMTAAVGQTRLMALYDEMFGGEGLRIGQILLTHDDLRHRERHLNTRNTVENLLRHGVVPIVNENDVVAVDEIKVGDNDFLASLVAHLVEADLLVLLTTTDGLRRPDAGGRSRRVPVLDAITPAVLKLASGKGDALSTGGMYTKLKAADEVARAGGAVVIADGRKPAVLTKVLAGADTGTFVRPSIRDGRAMRRKKRWLAFFHRAAGSLVVDPGACEALVHRGRSLLPKGIESVHGEFPIGALVNVETRDGRLVARGLVSYASGDLRRIRGLRTTEVARVLGRKDYDEVIHRDNMVLLV